ncbi:MAG TPA: 2-oxoglutarate and iron-dependent oxygenase domain-containing protein, partial [Vicinamibacteria bacterium]|nr:2-oxoglutarate and iron-dependent oxygenase domain-containing protein [Vicinamibacteria bacterium]
MADRKSLGIEATNQAYRRYDQVEKKQEYHLAEAAHQEAFDEDHEIRTCDIGRFLHGGAADKRAFARELGEALRDIGFAVLEGHGLDPRLYDEAEEKIVELFTEVPLEEKTRFRARRHGSVNQGYFPIKETSDIHPDLVEGWVFCRRAFDLGDDPDRPTRLEDFWPRPRLEPFFRRVCQAHERLILPVMQSILTHLGCDPRLYDRKLSRTNFGQRLNYYPAVAPEDEQAGGGRMLGHEDVDLFTFLPAPRVEGLQVLNRANMKWIRLAPPAGTIILN